VNNKKTINVLDILKSMLAAIVYCFLEALFKHKKEEQLSETNRLIKSAC